MATKVSLAKKSRKYGALAMVSDITNCTVKMFDHNQEKELIAITAELSDKGIPTLVIKGKSGLALYTSNTQDNYAREVNEENYEYDMALCPFVNQSTWESLVDNYFSFMMQDEEALAILRGIIAPALQLPPMQGNAPFDAVDEMEKIRVYARSLLGSEKSQGTRKPNLFKMIVNKNANWHFKGMLYRSVESYVKLNTKKQWEK